MLVHPPLLLRRAKGHPHKIRTALVDPVDNLLVLLLCQLSEGGRVHTRNPKLWIPPQKGRPQSFQRSLRAAVKVMAVAGLLGQIQNGRHQIRARHPSGLGKAPFSADNGERLSVGKGHGAAVLHVAVSLVAIGHHRGMHVGDTDIIAL